VQLNGSSSHGLTTNALALGTGDLWVSARMRVANVVGTTVIRCGILAGGNDLEFYIDGAVSTTNWRVRIDGVNTAPNGTPFAVNSTYARFDLARRSNVVTFAVNGTVLHTIASYTTSLTGGGLIVAAATSGICFLDQAILVVG
jgi:hypothetical protein